MNRIPGPLRAELRAAMCRDTYGRVERILDRWIEMAQAPMVLSGLDVLASRSAQLADIRAARQDVALSTIGNMLTRDGLDRGVIDAEEQPSMAQDANVTMFTARFLCARPRY